MAPALVPDTLWKMIEPLLPLPKPKPQGGRPRVHDRACLKGIVFVLRSGIPWEMLPRKLGCGSGMTCWRRLRDWQESGIWQLIHFAALDWLCRLNQIDWSRAVVDSCSVRAVFGGSKQVRILFADNSPRTSCWLPTRPHVRDAYYKQTHNLRLNLVPTARGVISAIPPSFRQTNGARR